MNSTEIASHLDLEDWRDIAAEFQRGGAAAVTRFGGQVAKYLGEGLMAYFGWPEAHENDAERAVRAGLAIVDDVAQLNNKVSSRHKVKLSVRVGIESGWVVMGQGATDVDVFGDVPNVAARVQSAADGEAVFITSSVHELVSGLFVVEDRGGHRLKGIERPVRLYRVFRPAITRGRTRGASPRALAPFVGREEDIRMLLSRWGRAREGHGQLVLVMGEPGIGKSRVMEEFRTRIVGHSHTWIDCAGEQFFQGTPFHAVTQLLNHGFGEGGNAAERVNDLERRLEQAQMKLSEALPLVTELLNLPIPERYTPLALTPEQRRKRLLANLTTWLLNAARVKPTVLAIEDLHWVDPSTLELMQTLVEQVATAPLFLLCTTRPEFRVPWSMRAHHAQITLNRLNQRQTREMVAGVAARAALTEGLPSARQSGKPRIRTYGAVGNLLLQRKPG
jgi:class 3 adenylate cyclase